jgi:hypothetical protein
MVECGVEGQPYPVTRTDPTAIAKFDVWCSGGEKGDEETGVLCEICKVSMARLQSYKKLQAQ